MIDLILYPGTLLSSSPVRVLTAYAQHSQAAVSSATSKKRRRRKKTSQRLERHGKFVSMFRGDPAWWDWVPLALPNQDTISARGRYPCLTPLIALIGIYIPFHSAHHSVGRTRCPNRLQSDSWNLIPSHLLTCRAVSSRTETPTAIAHVCHDAERLSTTHNLPNSRPVLCETSPQPKPKPKICLLPSARCSDWPPLRGPSAHRSVLHRHRQSSGVNQHVSKAPSHQSCPAPRHLTSCPVISNATAPDARRCW